MSDRDDSYEKYKQYRLNKYQYENNQKLLPIIIILVIAFVTAIFKYVLIALALVAVAIIIFLLYLLYLSKQLTAQPIVVTEDDVKEGVSLHITVNYNSTQAVVDFDLPENVKHGQKIKVKNVVFEGKNRKRTKKDVIFKIEIK